MSLVSLLVSCVLGAAHCSSVTEKETSHSGKFHLLYFISRQVMTIYTSLVKIRMCRTFMVLRDSVYVPKYFDIGKKLLTMVYTLLIRKYGVSLFV
jgi:hypothetical protein